MTWVNVGECCCRIRFTEMGYGNDRGVFRTRDGRLAEVLRSHSLYGRVITEDRVSGVEAECVEVRKEYAAVYPGVTRTQEANRILSERYGVLKECLKTRSDALREAERLNVSFPDLK